MAKKTAKPEVPAPMLLCTPGTFFVFAGKSVHIEVLTELQTQHLYEAMDMAERCVMLDVSVARAQALRQFFGPDSLNFMPANRDALLFYVEHYEGPLADTVKGIAACILTGTPYGADSGDSPDGGSRDRVQPQPKLGPTPSGNKVPLSQVSNV